MERCPLIHQPKQPVNQPQITRVVIGEGWHLNSGYGHVILQLEPNPDNDGCFRLWSASSEITDRLLFLIRELPGWMIRPDELRGMPSYGGNITSLFLAGEITGCTHWQAIVVEQPKETPLTLFNPQREQFPMGAPTASTFQIQWE